MTTTVVLDSLVNRTNATKGRDLYILILIFPHHLFWWLLSLVMFISHLDFLFSMKFLTYSFVHFYWIVCLINGEEFSVFLNMCLNFLLCVANEFSILWLVQAEILKICQILTGTDRYF